MEEFIEDIATPVEGRGDPASTILWSPRKFAGQKRPLELEETEESEEEEISDTEEAEAEAELSRLIEETTYYNMRDHMQVDETEETEDKSAPKPHMDGTTTEATLMVIEVPGQTPGEQTSPA